MSEDKKKELPIGFIDSGLGGISVLKKAVELMPYEDFIYYGDSKNAPYGTKSVEEIRRHTFAAVDHLLEHGIKGLAVACNTATSAAVRMLRGMYPDLPIVGIEPAIKPAVKMNQGGRILIMATPMTLVQEKFRKLLALYEDEAEIVPVPCDGLMEFVEKGDLDGDFLDSYFTAHLLPFVTGNTETIVLGCTHYPFLRPHLRQFLEGKDIQLIDGSFGTARELRRRLSEKNLLWEEERERQIIMQNSSPDPKMIDLSWKLLDFPID